VVSNYKEIEEERDCIVCLEMRADELMRRLVSGDLTNYSVVRTKSVQNRYRSLSEERISSTKHDVPERSERTSKNCC
jgi:predicted RNA-binding protein YlxR (DUF448 family)